MTSWWRLRTQVFLVLSVLLFLIAFLGTYALNSAKRHVVEADELFGASVQASSMLKEIEADRADELRAAAKFRVTGDKAYGAIAQAARDKVSGELRKLGSIVGEDASLGPVASGLARVHDLEEKVGGRAVPGFSDGLRELEHRLDEERAARVENLRVVAHDLGKIIVVAFIVAIAVTSWLGIILYSAVLVPLESIKRAARRIREGELSYRVERFRRFGGFDELSELRREFNSMAVKLEELDRMKTDFLSTVSHELKTPLTALKEGLMFLSEKHETLPPQVCSRTIEVCYQASKRLEAMIQNLLDHAKMESGFYSFDERPKNFISVVEAAIQGIKPIAERRGLTIELRADAGEVLAAFSAEGITHAVENLMLNAIKYGDNTRPITVSVRLHDVRPVPQLELRVTNHGRGLLPSDLKLVFERFFRASNADGQQGVGLGLSVVKRIIEAHHGVASAESADGMTTFSFRIPQRYESPALKLTSQITEARA